MGLDEPNTQIGFNIHDRKVSMGYHFGGLFPEIDTDSRIVEFIVDIEILPERGADVVSMSGSLFAAYRGGCGLTRGQWNSDSAKAQHFPICGGIR